MRVLERLQWSGPSGAGLGWGLNRRIAWTWVLVLLAPPGLFACRAALEPPPDRSDRDLDYVIDRLDLCPDEPEAYNGNRDQDGCPDSDALQVAVVEGRMSIQTPLRFLPDSLSLEPAAQQVLANLARILVHETKLVVRIETHVQPSSDPAADLKLTDQRAKALREALVKAGVSAARLQTAGRGGTKPLVPTSSADAVRLNERVELMVVSR